MDGVLYFRCHSLVFHNTIVQFMSENIEIIQIYNFYKEIAHYYDFNKDKL